MTPPTTPIANEAPRAHPDDRLARDTQLVETGPGEYDARIDTGWWVVQGPNGGYIAALVLGAMQRSLADEERVPRSLTVHYTSPPSEGPAQIEAQIERSGRSLSTVTARLLQGGKLRALAVGAFSTPRPSAEFSDLQMPEMPPASQIEPEQGTAPIALRERYDLRSIPGTGRDANSETATTAAWIRPDPAVRPLDAPLLAAYSDAIEPSVFALPESRGLRGPVPTVDLTIHFRNHDRWAEIGPEDHCLALTRTRLVEGGFLEEDGEIWSPDGHLLVHSRQLAVALPPF